MNKLFIFIFILFLLNPIFSSSFLTPLSDEISDYANIITNSDKNRIVNIIKQVEKQTGIEITVVTINSVNDYFKGKTIEEFANDLFNDWGVGHKKENNGIMLLVAIKDRKVRIQLGGGYSASYNSKMRNVVNSTMIPYFKGKEYSRGIYEGTFAIVKKVTKESSFWEYHKWHILMIILIIICVFAGINCMKNGKTGWGWVFFAAAGAILLFLIKAMLSGKSRSGFGGGSSFGGGASGSW